MKSRMQMMDLKKMMTKRTIKYRRSKRKDQRSIHAQIIDRIEFMGIIKELEQGLKDETEIQCDIIGKTIKVDGKIKKRLALSI